jgi:hypothetical protein
MSQVWAKSPQQGGHLLVLLAIADFADDNGVAWPSVSTLGRKARLSETSIHRILRQLQEAGELRIEREAGPHGCNLYVVGGTGAKIAPGAVGDTGGVPPVAPKPSIEPSGVTSPGEGFATEVASPSPAPKGAKAVFREKRKTQIPFTEDDRQHLAEKYQDQLQDVGFHVDQALNHTASERTKSLPLYVDGWLRREADKPWRKGPASRNGAPAPAGRGVTRQPMPFKDNMDYPESKDF